MLDFEKEAITNVGENSTKHQWEILAMLLLWYGGFRKYGVFPFFWNTASAIFQVFFKIFEYKGGQLLSQMPIFFKNRQGFKIRGLKKDLLVYMGLV